MKKLIILMTVVLLGTGLALAKKNSTKESASKNGAGAPAIEFAETVHDFGNIPEDGGYATCEFTFTNTGTAPLVILSTSASCGCTTPKAPKQPIAPGKSDKVTVSYSPKGRPGEFTKTITVRTNVPGKRTETLTISGFVKPAKDSKANK